MRPISPRSWLLLGAALTITGIAALGFGLASPGPAPWALLVVGLSSAAWGATASRPRARRVLARIFAATVSIYIALWIVELMLTYALNPRLHVKPYPVSIQGMFEIGEHTSYHHAPGFTGVFDDGLVQAPIVINSLGDRDDEARLDHPQARRILLIGDSFTFGQDLPTEQRIDRRIEQRSDGAVDAYNLGVMGYGAGNIIARMQESRWWRGDAVYYLFFVNDVLDDNLDPARQTVYDGYVVRRFGPDGTALDEAEWKQGSQWVRRMVDDPPSLLPSTLALTRLRGLLGQALDRNARLTGMPSDSVSPHNVERAIEMTRHIQDLAHERGARFTVVIVPALGEAAAQQYSSWTQTYVDGIKGQGYDVLELIDRLTGDDYFAHDPHFDAHGADVTAGAILEHWRRAHVDG